MLTRALFLTVIAALCAPVSVAGEGLASSVPAAAPKTQVESQKLKDIRHLLEVTGSGKLGAQVVDQLLDSFRESRLGVQPQILAESMALGEQWGRAAAERVIKRLNEKGYGTKSS